MSSADTDAPVEEAAPATRVEGDSAITSRFMHDIPAPPFWRAALRGNHLADDVPVDQVGKFETELLRFVENSRPGLLQSLREKKAVTDEIKTDLEQTLKDFKDVWAEKSAAVAA